MAIEDQHILPLLGQVNDSRNELLTAIGVSKNLLNQQNPRQRTGHTSMVNQMESLPIISQVTLVTNEIVIEQFNNEAPRFLEVASQFTAAERVDILDFITHTLGYNNPSPIITELELPDERYGTYLLLGETKEIMLSTGLTYLIAIVSQGVETNWNIELLLYPLRYIPSEN